jgi:hypothetical protein
VRADHQGEVVASGAVEGDSAVDLRRPAPLEGAEEEFAGLARRGGLRVVDARVVGRAHSLPLQAGVGGDVGEVLLERVDDVGEHPLPAEDEFGGRLGVGHVPDVEGRLESGIAVLAEALEEGVALLEGTLEVRDHRGEARIAGDDEGVDPRPPLGRFAAHEGEVLGSEDDGGDESEDLPDPHG